MMIALSILLFISAVCSCGAFSPTLQMNRIGVRDESIVVLKMSTSFRKKVKDDVNEKGDDRNDKGFKMSEALPFLRSPPLLEVSDLAGNAGFDPLNFAKNEEQLLRFRESEVKHSRIAMLVVSGLFLSALLDGTAVIDLDEMLGIPLTIEQLELEELNSLFSAVSGVPQFWGFCVGLTAACDMYDLAKAEANDDPEYFPGNVGFDPLEFYPPATDAQGRKDMQTAELKHGRTAMLAVAFLMFQEVVSRMEDAIVIA